MLARFHVESNLFETAHDVWTRGLRLTSCVHDGFVPCLSDILQ